MDYIHILLTVFYAALLFQVCRASFLCAPPDSGKQNVTVLNICHNVSASGASGYLMVTGSGYVSPCTCHIKTKGRGDFKFLLTFSGRGPADDALDPSRHGDGSGELCNLFFLWYRGGRTKEKPKSPSASCPSHLNRTVDINEFNPIILDFTFNSTRSLTPYCIEYRVLDPAVDGLDVACSSKTPIKAVSEEKEKEPAVLQLAFIIGVAIACGLIVFIIIGVIVYFLVKRAKRIKAQRKANRCRLTDFKYDNQKKGSGTQEENGTVDPLVSKSGESSKL